MPISQPLSIALRTGLKRRSAGYRHCCRAHLLPVIVGVTLALGIAPSVGAGVLQLVVTSMRTTAGPNAASRDEIFRLTSAEIDQNIFAAIGNPNDSFFASASAGQFGQLGMDIRDQGLPAGSLLTASVLIASDEFVNVFGRPADIRTQFIIDGGILRDFFSINGSVTFQLQVGAENVGQAAAISSATDMHPSGLRAAAFGGTFNPGGTYRAALTSDAAGNRSFATESLGGLDLGATFDAGNGRVEIPLSLQTLDLGSLGSGERVLLGYHASITIVQDGITEGMFGQFSDPLTLTGEPNPLITANGITITPIPEPSQVAMLLAGLGLVWRLGRMRGDGA